jgi:hypothetical protein
MLPVLEQAVLDEVVQAVGTVMLALSSSGVAM